MTEEEWLACTNPRPMLEFLQGKGRDRKLRLFACACCRRMWHLLKDKRCRQVVEASEAFADGAITAQRLAAAQSRAKAAASRAAAAYQAANAIWLPLWRSVAARRGDGPCVPSEEAAAAEEASIAAGEMLSAALLVVEIANGNAEEVAFSWEAIPLGLQVNPSEFIPLLRCLFGNPFRPADMLAAWRTPTVLALATAAYQERTFDRLPILADALEEAGCTNTEILSHCRLPGDHARGCWVVDAVLGKE
jgi:hypothetical protein